MGLFDIFKKSRTQVNRENQEQGKAGEKRIKEKYESSGYNVKRTGKGHDFKAERKDWFTGKKETKYIEVKTGNSKLSQLQRKKRGQFGKKYVVERLKLTFLGFVSNNRKSDKVKPRKKKSNSNLLGFDSIGWGYTTKKKTRKTTRRKSSSKRKTASIWGPSDSIFGSTKKTRKTTKRKSSSKRKTASIWGPSDSIFGSTKKTRKTTKRKSSSKKSKSEWDFGI